MERDMYNPYDHINFKPAVLYQPSRNLKPQPYIYIYTHTYMYMYMYIYIYIYRYISLIPMIISRKPAQYQTQQKT